MNYLESNHILNDYQYGFRSSHSCQAQLISIIEELQLALDNHHQVDLLMLDFSKAFDTVPHHLLKKLKYYRINGKLYCKYWLSTWLTKRSQRVVVDGYESKYIWCPTRNCFRPCNVFAIIILTISIITFFFAKTVCSYTNLSKIT